jgi:hypothetical protein
MVLHCIWSLKKATGGSRTRVHHSRNRQVAHIRRLLANVGNGEARTIGGWPIYDEIGVVKSKMATRLPVSRKRSQGRLLLGVHLDP